MGSMDEGCGVSDVSARAETTGARRVSTYLPSPRTIRAVCWAIRAHCVDLARCAARAYTEDLLARWRALVFVWDSWCFGFLVEVSLRLRAERAMDVVLDDCLWSRCFAFLAEVSLRLRAERAMDVQVVLDDCSCSRRVGHAQRIVTNIHAPLK